ncbi:amino acid ABC transporter permease [Nocardioides seonyuensis]|uniref:Amino acid ABC transporter permease n=1 Tax=Nocardioides seonyuensis TaxID=2518371 RepID=A0A4P7IFJ0_9ACTN|nr:amino acid ABC transporter permease [Nocardioides seonyuensis]QBX56044.1 amino acid ABC transporter permease [Nocardioides seonyuensis]
MSSGNVLFDAPGPRTIARHRIYSVAAWVVLVLAILLVVKRMNDEGELVYDKWEPFLTPDYIRVLLVDGLWQTVQAAVFAILGAVVFGLVFGIGKLSEHAWLRWPSWAVVEFFRAVPLLLLIIFIFFTYGTGDGIGSFWSLVLGLLLYNGSVLAEVFRAGINAVPKGQAEAAYAIGMRKSQVMVTVLLPQAVKIMLPAIISQMVVALKDTSLGYAILAPGLTRIGKSIYGEFGNQFQTVIVVASLYIAVNLLLTWLATWVQKRFVGEKKMLSVSMVGEQDQGSTQPTR